ncbi:MAG: TlpA family protein disulfide reductase [candidate division Zixibacteria bacterium]|nr:TlpA family protein disulfide reductase [candidate division Zixibacteria bacterium]
MLFRRSWLRICLLLVCMVVTIGLLGCEGKKESNPGKKKSDLSSTQELKESPQEGFLAPNFTLPDLGGTQISLGDFKGKVVLLNFWATWCAPCKMEIPSLERLYQLRKDKGFEILAVSVDRTSLSKVASFVADYQMSFPVLADQRGEVGRRYWAKAIPTSFLLDKKGVIRWKVVGTREWGDAFVLSKIDQLLSE